MQKYYIVEQMLSIATTPTQELNSTFLSDKGIRVLVKRDDQNHPLVMGNKWRKLKYNLVAAKTQQKEILVTYGGAYSNHILATAVAANRCGLKSVGIIRGDELTPDSNPTLQQASAENMRLVFVNRDLFNLYKTTLTVPDYLQKEVEESGFLLPEGGTNQLAIKGCEEIISEIEDSFDICCTAVGTGGTFLGLLNSLAPDKKLYGFSSLKGNWVGQEIKDLKQVYDISGQNYYVFDDQMFGGYGRFDQNLIQFILEFRQEYGILLDPIYTGKMFFRVWDMVKNDQIARGTTLLLLHTGGLQGIAGFNARFGQLLPES